MCCLGAVEFLVLLVMYDFTNLVKTGILAPWEQIHSLLILFSRYTFQAQHCNITEAVNSDYLCTLTRQGVMIWTSQTATQSGQNYYRNENKVGTEGDCSVQRKTKVV